MPCVTEVEGFIDERKIGNNIIDRRMFEHRPILPGRVVAMAAPNALTVDGQRHKYLAAPAFNPAGTKASAQPVSYTHLGVYKRQRQCSQPLLQQTPFRRRQLWYLGEAATTTVATLAAQPVRTPLAN